MLSLLSKQWSEYSRIHSTRANFVAHLITVPIFMAGSVAVLWGLCTASFMVFAFGLLGMMAALAVQGWGHKQERQPPSLFTSKWNALARIVLEQWVTFPRYVLHKLLHGRNA